MYSTFLLFINPYFLHKIIGKCLLNERVLLRLHEEDTSQHSRGF